jgi:hypothetical protein
MLVPDFCNFTQSLFLKTNKRIYQNGYDLLKLFDNDFDKASKKL